MRIHSLIISWFNFQDFGCRRPLQDLDKVQVKAYLSCLWSSQGLRKIMPPLSRLRQSYKSKLRHTTHYIIPSNPTTKSHQLISCLFVRFSFLGPPVGHKWAMSAEDSRNADSWRSRADWGGGECGKGAVVTVSK